ncbi:MAG: ferrochelatase [Gammaproteobacteria bacterium]
MKSPQKNKSGILLINLGTPSSPEPNSVRRYLAEFLSDSRVIEIPKILWLPLLHGIILRRRPKQSAKLYKKIWMPEGSPLLVYSSQITEKLNEILKSDNTVVELGMCYQNPSVEKAIERLSEKGISELTVLPLYPQYSSSTTAAAFDKVTQTLQKMRNIPHLNFIKHYCYQDEYIRAMAQQIQSFWRTHEKPQKLVFSFHGIPEKRVKQGDPYSKECYDTAHAIAERLQLSHEEWDIVFQSRFGRAEWLQPYCEPTLRAYPEHGVKSIHVVCPGFAVDCLETLEEINMQMREAFLDAGGERFEYIPALNDSEAHVEALREILIK